MSGAEPSARRYAAREVSRGPPTSVLSALVFIVGARVLLLQREATHTKRGTRTRASTRQLSSPRLHVQASLFPARPHHAMYFIHAPRRSVAQGHIDVWGAHRRRSKRGESVLPALGKRLRRVYVYLVFGCRTSPTSTPRPTPASRVRQAQVAQGAQKVDWIARARLGGAYTPSTSSCILAVRSASSLSVSVLDRAVQPTHSEPAPKIEKAQVRTCGEPPPPRARVVWTTNAPTRIPAECSGDTGLLPSARLHAALSGLPCTPVQAQNLSPLQG